MPVRLPRALAPLALLLLPAVVPAVSAADTVVPGNQIVQGFQCVGATCANGETQTGPTLMSKSTDTPGLRLLQTAGLGFTPQTWDVAGNEANFFVRDLTGGSRLPFRIRPGAPTSSIDIGANGDTSTAGVVQQTVTALTPVDAVDGDAVLAALRGLTISHFSVGGTTRAMPAGPAFFTAFGLGGSPNSLAPQDVASVALAAVKALDARVSTLALTPGPKGTTGASGTAGPKGDAGAPGGTGAPAPAADLAKATARIATLERSNKKLTKSLSTLQKQVRKLVSSSKKPTAHRSSGSGGRANGR
jgi:hypothetical protein